MARATKEVTTEISLVLDVVEVNLLIKLIKFHKPSAYYLYDPKNGIPYPTNISINEQEYVITLGIFDVLLKAMNND